jgi:hypothetical protein
MAGFDYRYRIGAVFYTALGAASLSATDECRKKASLSMPAGNTGLCQNEQTLIGI